MAHQFSRREVLLAGAGVAVLAACGSDSKDTASGGDTPSTTASTLNPIVASFLLVPGRAQRVSFAVLRDRTPLPADVEVKVAFAPDGGDWSDPVVAARHSEGIENRPYYTATTTFAEPGIYALAATVGGTTATAALEVPDTAKFQAPLPGEKLPSMATPTTADGRGVNPICTADPVCPWHTTSLDAALGAGKPVALLISTPKYCQSQVCGPVLDNLLAAAPGFEDRIQFVHAEVYADDTLSKRAPIMQTFGLEFEPILYLMGADGTIKNAVDGPVDRGEGRSLLEGLLA